MTKRRNWSAEEKVEIVLAGIKGEKSIAQICRDNNISQTTYYNSMFSLWLKRQVPRFSQGGIQERDLLR